MFTLHEENQEKYIDVMAPVQWNQGKNSLHPLQFIGELIKYAASNKYIYIYIYILNWY